MKSISLLALLVFGFGRAQAATQPEIFVSAANPKLRVELLHLEPATSDKMTQVDIKVVLSGRTLVEAKTWINFSRVELKDKSKGDSSWAYGSAKLDGAIALTTFCDDDAEEDCDEVVQESLDIGIDLYGQVGQPKYRISFTYRQPDNLTNLDRPLQYAGVWEALATEPHADAVINLDLERESQPATGYFYLNEVVVSGILKWAAARPIPKGELYLETFYWNFKTTGVLGFTVTRFLENYIRSEVSGSIPLTNSRGDLLSVDELAKKIQEKVWP